ncbi:hypothetical protein LTS10_001578 [Elasticomyces elasticus]|nr:hypothetical protein LTS10_001578 [Elasticomyces elasticus]
MQFLVIASVSASMMAALTLGAPIENVEHSAEVVATTDGGSIKMAPWQASRNLAKALERELDRVVEQTKRKDVVEEKLTLLTRKLEDLSTTEDATLLARDAERVNINVKSTLWARLVESLNIPVKATLWARRDRQNPNLSEKTTLLARDIERVKTNTKATLWAPRDRQDVDKSENTTLLARDVDRVATNVRSTLWARIAEDLELAEKAALLAREDLTAEEKAGLWMRKDENPKEWTKLLAREVVEELRSIEDAAVLARQVETDSTLWAREGEDLKAGEGVKTESTLWAREAEDHDLEEASILA